MTSLIDKTALRRRLRGLRRRLATEAPDAGERAAARLPVERLPQFEAFSVYTAQGSEIDPGPLASRLQATGARLVLPVVIEPAAPLIFRLFEPAAPLEPDALGIPGPPPSSPAVLPDLVVVPMLAFDRKGARLGQGGGFYDRTLADLRARKPVFILGLAFSGQEVADLPAEPHDERLDAILTETDYIEVS